MKIVLPSTKIPWVNIVELLKNFLWSLEKFIRFSKQFSAVFGKQFTIFLEKMTTGIPKTDVLGEGLQLDP